MADELHAAQTDLVNADANDRAKIGRIQAAIKLYDGFTSGYVQDGFLSAVKAAEKERLEKLNG